MADEDYGDDEMMGFDDDLDWLYVEDEYNLADELAETQVAEPGYPGTNYELAMEEYEYDLYAYYDDLEYGDDSYWEYGIRQDGSQLATSGQKRKRGTPALAATKSKRRKVLSMKGEILTAGGAEQLDTVLYMGQQERSRKRIPPLLEKKQAYAFLGDWRKRFAGKDGVIEIEEMPVDMQKAAEAQDDETPTKARHAGEVMEDVEDEEAGWEDESEEDDEDEGGGVDLSALDPHMLKQILKQKLKDAGLEGSENEGAFMDTLRRMLAGDEDAAAGELANTLLGQATEEEGDGAFSGWLSQQGVSLEQREEEDTSSVAPEEVPQKGVRGKSGKKQQDSPPDSAVSVVGSSQVSTNIAVRGGSPEGKQKHAAMTAGRTGKNVGFELPASRASASKGTDQSDPATSHVAKRTARSKATSSSAARQRAARSNGRKMSPSEQLQEELEEDVEVHEAAERSVRSSRKRKACDQESKEGDDGGAEKRAVKEPTTRRTRSAMAKGGR